MRDRSNVRSHFLAYFEKQCRLRRPVYHDTGVWRAWLCQDLSQAHCCVPRGLHAECRCKGRKMGLSIKLGQLDRQTQFYGRNRFRCLTHVMQSTTSTADTIAARSPNTSVKPQPSSPRHLARESERAPLHPSTDSYHSSPLRWVPLIHSPVHSSGHPKSKRPRTTAPILPPDDDTPGDSSRASSTPRC